MTTKETVVPANPAAEKVLKICLIISAVLGVIITVLRLIRGENFFHAVLAVLPAISILAVFYLIILSRRGATTKT
jgi:membrane-associated PAP2 superfamily phosphatase